MGPWRKNSIMNMFIKSYKKVFLSLLIAAQYSCSPSTSDKSTLVQTKAEIKNITPKISKGNTFINLKNGDSNLVLNLKVGSKGNNLTSDGTPVFSTKAESSNQSQSGAKLGKIATELIVNTEKLTFDIPADKINNNEHSINISGLKKDDIVSLNEKVYDDNGNIIGSESVKDKKIEKDIESLDINISVNINIGVNVAQNVTVSQTQTVAGPTINIILPSPPAQSNSANCNPAGPPDHTATLKDGTKVKVCNPESKPTDKCYRMDGNNNVTLEDGRIVNICRPR